MTQALCPCCGQTLSITLQIDPACGYVRFNGVGARLTPLEMAILQALPGSTEKIIFAVWRGSQEPDSAVDSIRVLITRLRRKLAGLSLIIRCVRGYGYFLETKNAARAEV